MDIESDLYWEVFYAGQNCIGSQDGEDKSRIWFTRWFLDTWHVEAPGVVWYRDGDIITKTYKDEYVRPSGKPNPPVAIFVLTDQKKGISKCDHNGNMYHQMTSRLGVWPD